MCFFSIPVHYTTRRRRYITKYIRSTSNLHYLSRSSPPALSLSIGLWNCQSAVNKADFIPEFASHASLHALALTETWIRPENTATPAALSVNHSFTHSPRSTGRGGGTGLLLSPHIKYTSTPLPVTAKSFEHHCAMLTDPIKACLIVLYRPPGPLADFVEELDMLLSVLPDDGTPLIVLGDFNIHLQGTQAVDFLSLLTSFDLTLLSTPATHKAGKQLDLILTRNCITDLTSVTPLHISDHYFIQFSISLPPTPSTSPPLVTFRRNLRSLSPSHFSSIVTSSLPPIDEFSSHPTNTATDTLLTTLTASLDSLCPLSTRPARSSPSCPWLTDVIREERSTLRAAERRWRKSKGEQPA
ncbi:uncharacterized protein LOC134020883 isoform X2 [Osmerus eperlanus]|uniref:uncharacterized protein LOC134020883 isoform X2 n=1 Tax=Osmerus eperlanus TaxID=29151 RepID=UPI002E0F6652